MEPRPYDATVAPGDRSGEHRNSTTHQHSLCMRYTRTAALAD